MDGEADRLCYHLLGPALKGIRHMLCSWIWLRAEEYEAQEYQSGEEGEMH